MFVKLCLKTFVDAIPFWPGLEGLHSPVGISTPQVFFGRWPIYFSENHLRLIFPSFPAFSSRQTCNPAQGSLFLFGVFGLKRFLLKPKMCRPHRFGFTRPKRNDFLQVSQLTEKNPPSQDAIVTTRTIVFLVGDSYKPFICHWHPGFLWRIHASHCWMFYGKVKGLKQCDCYWEGGQRKVQVPFLPQSWFSGKWVYLQYLFPFIMGERLGTTCFPHPLSSNPRLCARATWSSRPCVSWNLLRINGHSDFFTGEKKAREKRPKTKWKSKKMRWCCCWWRWWLWFSTPKWTSSRKSTRPHKIWVKMCICRKSSLCEANLG